jgi:hypothetical protein
MKSHHFSFSWGLNYSSWGILQQVSPEAVLQLKTDEGYGLS